MCVKRGLLLLWLCFPVQALAQTSVVWPSFDLERLDPDPGATGSLLVRSGELLPARSLRLSALAHYEHRPLLLFQEGQLSEVVSSRTTLELGAAYVPLEWLQLDLRLPLAWYQSGSAVSAGGLAQVGGLSTATLDARVGVLSQRAGAPLDVAIQGEVGVPLGSSEGLVKDNGLRAGLRAMAGRQLGGYRVGVEAGALVRPSALLTPAAAKTQEEIGSALRFGVMLATTGGPLRFETDVRVDQPLVRQPTGAEWLVGGRLMSSAFELYALAGVGLGSAPGTPLFRVLLGAAYDMVPPVATTGSKVAVPESKVAVPGSKVAVPEPKVAVPGSKVAVPEPKVVASVAPVKTEDRDGDGVEDADDTCPDQPGPMANHGCPLRDRDGDGIDDDQDECPDEKGPPELKGCPVRDSDKDGVLNRVDSCVLEPGPVENLGCPRNETPLVELKPTLLELKQKIYFKPGTAAIEPRSFELLNWVVRVLNEHVDQLPRVLIGAHLDDQGGVEQSRKLTQQRAEAVRSYLTERKVAPGRLQAKGYGPDVPIDTNATSAGRENNRRVELTFPPQDIPRAQPAHP